jgi:hypothetical protein
MTLVVLQVREERKDQYSTRTSEICQNITNLPSNQGALHIVAE